MDAPQTLGQRLREAMVAAGVKNKAIADAAGVHINTVSQWLNDRFPPSEEALASIAPVVKRSTAWLRYGAGAVSDPITVSEPAAPYAARHARNLPLAVREYLAEFQLRLVKGGASEDEIDEAMRLLKSPDVFSYFKGGRPTEFNEQDVLNGMRAIGEDVIVPRLKKLGRKVK
jgi:transcriptional regulator with XRE-family HTH domain